MTVLVDTNILIYHTKGSQIATTFLARLLAQQALHISILTKIEFLGWDKHTPEGFEKGGRESVGVLKPHSDLQEGGADVYS